MSLNAVGCGSRAVGHRHQDAGNTLACFHWEAVRRREAAFILSCSSYATQMTYCATHWFADQRSNCYIRNCGEQILDFLTNKGELFHKYTPVLILSFTCNRYRKSA